MVLWLLEFWFVWLVSLQRLGPLVVSVSAFSSTHRVPRHGGRGREGPLPLSSSSRLTCRHLHHHHPGSITSTGSRDMDLSKHRRFQDQAGQRFQRQQMERRQGPVTATTATVPQRGLVGKQQLRLTMLLPWMSGGGVGDVASFSLISATDRWGNWMILLGNAALAQIVGKQTSVGRLLGPPVTAMALTFVMATCGILPAGGTEASRWLQTLALQLATPLVLLGADLRRQTLAKRCGPLLVSFVLAAVATLVACVVGWTVVGASLSTAFVGVDGQQQGQQQGLILAAALMAKNIGGGLNYMAVCSTLQASPTAIAAGLCVDNLFALVYFPVTSYLAAGRPDPISMERRATAITTQTTATLSNPNQQPSSWKEEEDRNNPKQTAKTSLQNDHDDDDSSNNSMAAHTSVHTVVKGDDEQSCNAAVSVENVSNVLFLSATLLFLGQRLGAAVFGASGAGAASLPLCTLLTVLLASNAPESTMLQPLRPAAQVLGTVALYVFFATAGAPGLVVAESVRDSLIPLGLYLTLLYSLHGSLLWMVYKIHQLGWLTMTRRSDNAMKDDTSSSSISSSSSSWLGQCLAIPRLLCASSAAIGGPATAVALAQAANWESLQVPSLLVGNLGYATATFLGLAYHAYFSSFSM